ncbi:Putative calcium-binding mitochondrial carrier F55A11.4 [Seminavis robusta]|uniref:Calcium-binding mitochondrial carrier F55A11.4 n=1 Tax=Seminavis robusta TaxID=568900 RepID=A0A9N8E4J5_9STRA|nr:Putative calcium-binding mitochondrial carrier F55A11.4 [Seminavis robusta]|eukprot:Sro611_g175390.1 Putative calcium-binding mitochondrial carrier F55A11.4 (363) ;mRNA; r:53972-55351
MSSKVDEESSTGTPVLPESRTVEAAKHLFCGGIAGSVAKTVTAPFSRLTILFQVHSMVTTKEHRPIFAMSLREGVQKILERGGFISLWKGNLTSVLHRFPYSGINFFVYENVLDMLTENHEDPIETSTQLARRMSHRIMNSKEEEQNTAISNDHSGQESSQAYHKFLAGAISGSIACCACYPLDLVRTRLTTELEGREHYRGIVDAVRKIYTSEGPLGFYSGLGPTLAVAVPNFSISFAVYGTMKEYALDDELFYNLRRIDADSGEEKIGLVLTVLCGACSGTMATLVTFPFDTIRRRMQVQSLHVPPELRLNSFQQFYHLVHKEGLRSIYRGLTPELLKVIPMVGTMFTVYEFAKEHLNVK